MKIQIYTMQSPEEALALAALGVDHLGVTPGQRGLPGEVDLMAAQAIVKAVRGRAVSVALSVESDLETIEAMVQAVRPDILHLCGLAGALSPEAVRKLRARLPGLPIMQAVSVTGPEVVEAALAYQSVADFLILDTQAPPVSQVSGPQDRPTIGQQVARPCGACELQ